MDCAAATESCPPDGCVDTNFDPRHCGSCGNACGVDEFCMDGTCQCSGGRTSCGAACVDVRNDASNCGACGNVCPVAGVGFSGSACVSRSCDLDCDMGVGNCDADPSNGCEQSVTSDASNCGACGLSCGAGGTCALSSCDPILQIARSANGTCVVRGNGTLLCWGSNQFGQNAQVAAPTVSSAPVTIPLPGVASAVAMGDRHVCAIAFNPMLGHDDVVCWGTDDFGQLGDGAGSPADPHVPRELFFSSTPVQITAGMEHTCVLDSDGVVWCWGHNDIGQAGVTGGVMQVDSPTVIVSDSRYAFLAAGSAHTCVSTPFISSMECWGAGVSGQLGTGTNTNNAMPSPTMGFMEGDVLALALGREHTCVARTAGLYCWGGSASSQIDFTSNVPQIHGHPGGRATDLLANRLATCLRVESGAIYCRGEQSAGRLLVPGTTGTVTTWSRVFELGFEVDSFAVGNETQTQLVRMADGSVFGWGNNNNHQLTNFTPSGSPPPTRIVLVTP
jgi:alpha-tubulin suppressor-like RCC1 family protein